MCIFEVVLPQNTREKEEGGCDEIFRNQWGYLLRN